MARIAPDRWSAPEAARSADPQSSSDLEVQAAEGSLASANEMSLVERTGALAADLCQVGRNAGLDAVGVCEATPFDEARVSLNFGLDHGWDAGMQFTYRNPYRSTDPSRSLDGAAAMIVGARCYDRQPRSLEPERAGGTDRPRGAVARYAWQDHYSDLRYSLGRVADHLRERGWRAAVIVDDNALVDRAAAVRAGLGWYGKNTNVLIPGAGSWFVLGSVVTDAPLLGTDSHSLQRNQRFPDAGAAKNAKGLKELADLDRHSHPPRPATLTPGPVDDGCGACRRCVDACPTGALTNDQPGHLDARKCLAWLVQAPGIFPWEHRVALHDRMYGCDDCQDVCPVNRLAARHTPPSPADHDATLTVDILEILDAGDNELLRKLGRWYIPSRDPKYLRRNALIVLGNIGDPTSDAVRRVVSQAVAHPDPIIRAHAVWAAARLGYGDLLTFADHDPFVQQELRDAPSVPARATGR